MPKKSKLTAVAVETKGPGFHNDGDVAGLYLAVSEATAERPRGSRRWIYRYTSPTQRTRREMGLGPAAGKGSVSLADARTKAAAARRLVLDGLDPITVRDDQEAAQRAAEAHAATPALTFGSYADQWIDDNEHSFRNPKHVAQWRMTLREYGAPLRGKALDAITTEDVLAALKPIWQSKPETAKRTQGRIERVLDAAKATGLREGENPARWRGHLALILPKERKGMRKHHAAMHYTALSGFIPLLRERDGIAARALEFLILTAARSGEVRLAEWSEFDLAGKLWTVPADRMKAGKEHAVPLTARAIEILETVAKEHGSGGLVFPGQKPGQPLSDMTLTAVLRRMKQGDVTAHGFRSAFRDWAEDVGGFPHGVIKAALAHTISDKTDRAYRRGNALEKRRAMMDAWEAYMSGAGAESNVVQLRA